MNSDFYNFAHVTQKAPVTGKKQTRNLTLSSQ